MLTGKFINNLKLLDNQQLNNLERFINSPFFLKRKNLPALFTAIRKYYPEFYVSKSTVFSEAFPGKEYNDVLMRKYISELGNMLNDFLAVDSFRNDRRAYSGKLIDKLIELKNYDEAEKTAAETIAELEKSSLRNEKYYYNKYTSRESHGS